MQENKDLAIYNRTHDSGTISACLFTNQFFGATQIRFGLSFNHAPHQEKELFAIILC